MRAGLRNGALSAALFQLAAAAVRVPAAASPETGYDYLRVSDRLASCPAEALQTSALNGQHRGRA